MRIDFKTAIIILLTIWLLLSTVIGLHRKATINNYKRDIQIEREKLIVTQAQFKRELVKVRDSLNIAFLLLADSKADTEKARAEAIKAKKKYVEIIYIHYPTDSVRLRALSELYPSIGYY